MTIKLRNVTAASRELLSVFNPAQLSTTLYTCNSWVLHQYVLEPHRTRDRAMANSILKRNKVERVGSVFGLFRGVNGVVSAKTVAPVLQELASAKCLVVTWNRCTLFCTGHFPNLSTYKQLGSYLSVKLQLTFQFFMNYNQGKRKQNRIYRKLNEHSKAEICLNLTIPPAKKALIPGLFPLQRG